MSGYTKQNLRDVENQAPKFKMPAEKYSGSEDPVSHLESFVQQMEIQNASRSAMCKMFPTTLTDCAKTWRNRSKGYT